MTIKGAHLAILSWSSVYSMLRNSVLGFRASYRVFRKSAWSSPMTKLMCGTVLMKPLGDPITLLSTKWDQNWRESWNCSLMCKALEGSTEPSFAAGE
ncbi:hypothetical protein D3C73_1526080 [compost metagenome]